MTSVGRATEPGTTLQPVPQPGPPSPRPGPGGPRRALRSLVAVGPVALVFGIYGAAIDHIPQGWFSADWVRYLFSVFGALCVGLLLRQALQLPAVARFLGEPNPNLPLIGATGEGQDATGAELWEILDGTRAALLSDYRCRDRGQLTLCGWSQYLNDTVAPTALGSAYGLRIAMALDIRDARVDRQRVIESVLSLQRTGGGWSASNQRDIGRAEVTAWVLGAIAPAGLDLSTRTGLVSRLEELLDPADDPTGMNRTTVLTAAVGTLAALAPASPRLAEIATRLANAASTVPGRKAMACWGETLQGPPYGPSVPHTARVVVALQRAAVALPDRAAALRARAEEGIRWLRANLDFKLYDEQIRRPFGDDVEILLIGHFTPAWVARALMGGPTPATAELDRAVREILTYQERGVWRWQGMEPTWMAYQGVQVLRDYSLRHPRLPA